MAKASGKAGALPFWPHIHGPFSIERMMWDVVIALLPAGLASVIFFGTNSLRIIGLSLLTAVLTELLMNLLTKRQITVLDGSAVITALLFAYNLPPAAPWYLVITGAAFSIAVVKWAFGGLGYNFMNPALGGRIFVMAAWTNIMVGHWSPTILSALGQGQTLWGVLNNWVDLKAVSDKIISYDGISSATSVKGTIDAINSASPLTTLKAGGWDAVRSAGFDNYFNLIIGNRPGCIGETSALALFIGFIYLLARRVITPVIPVVYIGTAGILCWIFGGIPLGMGLFSGDPFYHILSGGLILGACFMATDPVTSPVTLKGSLIYAILLGVLTVLIRLWGGYPEGVSYAIVLMNIFVPLIDRYTRSRIFGYGSK